MVATINASMNQGGRLGSRLRCRIGADGEARLPGGKDHRGRHASSPRAAREIEDLLGQRRCEEHGDRRGSSNSILSSRAAFGTAITASGKRSAKSETPPGKRGLTKAVPYIPSRYSLIIRSMVRRTALSRSRGTSRSSLRGCLQTRRRRCACRTPSTGRAVRNALGADMCSAESATDREASAVRGAAEAACESSAAIARSARSAMDRDTTNAIRATEEE